MYHLEGIMQHLRINAFYITYDVSSRSHYATLEELTPHILPVMYYHEDIMQHLRINVLHFTGDVSSKRHYATLENQRFTHYL